MTLLQARVNAAKSRRGRKLLAIMSEVDKVGKDEGPAVLDSIPSDAVVPPEARAIEDLETGLQAGAKGKEGWGMPKTHEPLSRSHLTLNFNTQSSTHLATGKGGEGSKMWDEH